MGEGVPWRLAGTEQHLNSLCRRRSRQAQSVDVPHAHPRYRSLQAFPPAEQCTCSIKSLKSSPPSQGLAAAKRPGCTCGARAQERKLGDSSLHTSVRKGAQVYTSQGTPRLPLPGSTATLPLSMHRLRACTACASSQGKAVLSSCQNSFAHRRGVQQAAVARALPVAHVVAEDAAVSEERGAAQF